MKTNSILIVAPHPDDETLGCGGTLAKRVSEQCDVAVVVLTDGCNLFRLSPWKIEADPTPAETSAMRKAETRRAVDILGGDSKAIRFLDIEDATLAEHVDSVSDALAAIIADVDPNEIYVTSEYEEHADHVAACQAVRAAMAKARTNARLLRYVIDLRDGVSVDSIPDPVVEIDVSEQIDAKRRAVRQFKSHLTIVAKGQSEPFFAGIEPWVGPVETFFVDHS